MTHRNNKSELLEQRIKDVEGRLHHARACLESANAFAATASAHALSALKAIGQAT